ncbi:GumC family protein [Zobellella maritima]|uniref:GumC family protein n=1 Tax=Zobellella maritima TaxID=2059725 RepID=UPI000E30253F|nr:polysaccharide biosynthesis tyrosine autokinase [Zobellella maritima]
MDIIKLPGVGHDEKKSMDLLAPVLLWRFIAGRIWSIIFFTLIVATLTVLLVSNMTRIYRATATLLFENKAANVLSIEQIYGVEGGDDYLVTQFELLKSRALAERVVRNLGLDTHPEFDPRQQPGPFIDWQFLLSKLNPIIKPEQLEEDVEPVALSEIDIFDQVVEDFQRRVSVSIVGRTQLIEVSTDMADATTAALAANALADGYIESQLEAKMEMTQTATNWMNERLISLKNTLSDSERRLQEFLEQENLLNLEGITTVSATELSGISGKLTDARQERNAAESQYNQLMAMKGASYRRLASVPAVMADPLVAQFKAAEATANAKVQELSRRYGSKHPAMVVAQTELNSARANLKAQVEQVVASIKNSYQLAVASERGLQSSFEQNKEQVQSISRNEFRLRELQREVESNRTLYDTFMTRLKETTATQDLDTVNARVVDRALVPKRPIKPQMLTLVMAASVVALIVATGVVILQGVLDRTFKGDEEVENNLNQPVLGVIPLVKGKPGKLTQLFRQDTDPAFSESIRSLRTSLVLASMDRSYKVIMVTSSVPSEGKTSLSSNLAMALGQIEKTLLIDADMRRPSIAKTFDLPAGTPGLANLIIGSAEIQDCIIKLEGIDVITTGTVPPNPQELLSSERLSGILKQLEAQYERIIIDTAPTLGVSDALLLSRYTNAVIFVVKSDATSIPVAQSGLGKLLQVGAPVKGVVLNQLDVKKAQKYGYGYSGYYGDYNKPEA